MNFTTVNYEVQDQIAKITMNRPERMNALNHALWNDLDAAFDEAGKDPQVRVVILSGAGRAFCSGWDLKEGPYTSVPEGYEQWGTGNALSTLRGISGRYLKIMNFPKPTVAQVHGYCLATGCYLELLCDVAYAAENAVFGHPATAGGGVDSMPFVWFLGARNAKEFLMTRRYIDGKEAQRIGLVNKAVSPEKLEEEVWKLAKDMAVVPTEDSTAGGHGMTILKENINADMEIMGLGALFTYHRHLNAWGHAGLGKGQAFEQLNAKRKQASP